MEDSESPITVSHVVMVVAREGAIRSQIWEDGHVGVDTEQLIYPSGGSASGLSPELSFLSVQSLHTVRLERIR